VVFSSSHLILSLRSNVENSIAARRQAEEFTERHVARGLYCNEINR
jgi:hypothetical protein